MADSRPEVEELMRRALEAARRARDTAAVTPPAVAVTPAARPRPRGAADHLRLDD